MFEGAMPATPRGIMAKTVRRMAVGLAIGVGAGFLLLHGWTNSTFGLFFRTVAVALSATAAFTLFEIWPRRLPRRLARWARRSVVLNLRVISHVTRHDNETAEIHLKGRREVLPVSRHYVHLFRQM